MLLHVNFAYDATDTGEISLVEGEDAVIEKGDVDGWTHDIIHGNRHITGITYVQNWNNRYR
jgi:hypothetical protein